IGTRRTGLSLLAVLGAAGATLVAGALLYVHSASGNTATALSSEPRRVAVATATAEAFRATRRYVGTIQPWLSADIGPQMVSAYVDTVLVRPGDVVKKGAVVATLDCRHASAMNKAVAAQAKAVDALHTAAASEAGRVASLLDGKYVSENEVDQRKADVASKEAQLAALQAQMTGSELQVNDCVLRAPFDGEVATRSLDPGGFARPGSSLLTMIDRSLVRITAEVPENDFGAVAPQTDVRVHVLASGKDVASKISRRAPAADPSTRTTHIEIDVPDTDRALPVWTTADVNLDVGQPIPAVAIPLAAATVHAGKAKLFVVEGDVAHIRRAAVIGERNGVLYVDPKGLAAGAKIVTDGRNLLDDGDRVVTP
ncbi:MAG TPA: efflux RND transporter periplasmic adaptor subunit, partial [Kofleriaceae bacterium]